MTYKSIIVAVIFIARYYRARVYVYYTRWRSFCSSPSLPDACCTMYEPPSLEYLAWVPSVRSNPNSPRWLKCLLCDKWVSEITYHSDSLEATQYHIRKLRAYHADRELYDRIRLQRLRYHPTATNWRMYSDRKGKYYFHNRETNQSVWNLPPGESAIEAVMLSMSRIRTGRTKRLLQLTAMRKNC